MVLSRLLANNGQKQLPVISARVTSNRGAQSLLIHLREHLFYLYKIDLTPGDHDPDEGGVVGAGPFHGVVQPLSEEGGPVLRALHCKAGMLQLPRAALTAASLCLIVFRTLLRKLRFAADSLPLVSTVSLSFQLHQTGSLLLQFWRGGGGGKG